jgi:hypothetical protein
VKFKGGLAGVVVLGQKSVKVGLKWGVKVGGMDAGMVGDEKGGGGEVGETGERREG